MAIRGDHPSTNKPADERAIDELFEQLLEDWARGDGEAYGSRFIEGADYVAFDGTRTGGRSDISTSHQELFDKWLRGSRLTGRILSVKFLSPDVALAHATGGTVLRGKARPSPERDSIQTLVAVKRDEQWRFAAFHNSRVRSINGGFASFVIWAFTDLLWKVFGAKKRGTRG